MAKLATQRCQNHAQREAVARCMSCQGYFCRECVTEHDGRMTCKHCLEQTQSAKTPPQRRLLRNIGQLLLAAISLLMCAYLFYQLGNVLVSSAETFYHRPE